MGYRHISSLFSLIILMLLSSCVLSPETRKLRNAEALIESYPDSALVIARQIDPSQLSEDVGHRGRHAILVAMANINKGLPVDNYDDLDEACRYLIETGSGDIYTIHGLYCRLRGAEERGYKKQAFEDALRAYDIAFHEDEHRWQGITAEIIARYYEEEQCPLDAATYLHDASKEYHLAGDSISAKRTSRLALKLAAKALEREKTTMAAVERDFYHELYVDYSFYRTVFVYMLLALIFAPMLVHYGWKYVKRRQTLKIIRLERAIQEIGQLAAVPVGNSPETTGLLEQLFKERWTTINELAEAYQQGVDDPQQHAQIMERVETELDKMRSPESLAAIMEEVNTHLGGLIDKIREQIPAIKEKDLVFLSLLATGFAPRTVCLFLNMTTANFYKKRSRLIERISASDAPDREFILSKIKG